MAYKHDFTKSSIIPPPDTTEIQGKKYKPASKGDFELLKLKIEAAKRKDTLLAKLKQCSCT